MPRVSTFREIVSGRRQGLTASLARAALGALELPYTTTVRLRNRHYDRSPSAVQRVAVPVVSIGNLTLGGTGKTPTVEWLARWFADRQVRVGLASRGYGSKPGAPNDEALELAQKLPSVPHVLDRDRVRGAQQLIDQFRCQLVILDDGFQHRRLGRDLDIVLIDALEPVGFGHVFPRGTLREPLEGWSRAGVLVLTRAELVDEPQRQAIRDEARRYAPRAIWVEASHAPRSLVSASSQEQPLETLCDKTVAAFCGIGNPAGFRRSLLACGCKLASMEEFDDHFAYTPLDAETLAARAGRLGVEAVICTHKDLVKIGPLWRGAVPLWALAIRMQITAGEGPLAAALEPLAERAKKLPR